MDQLDKFIWLPKILKHVVWTPTETIFNTLKNKCEAAVQVTLRDAVEERFRDSNLGSFLYHLNSVQRQEISVQEDKLEIVMYDLSQKIEDVREFQRRNDICEDVIGLIEDSLLGNSTGKIHLSEVLSVLPVLRLAASKITSMDDSLANLAVLKSLVLSGNHLNDFPGKCLPRSLNYLELFCNCVSDVKEILTDSPSNLLYIGLGRNNISTGSLSQLSELQNICYLDLEDNNIEDLTEIMTVLALLKSLCSLILQGNPCSMSVGYKSAIVSSAPQLLFLDRIHLTTKGNEIEKSLIFQMSGALQIFGIRIIGIPKPAAEKFNNKKVKHTFLLELECPLLDSNLKAWDPDKVKVEENIITDEPVIEKNKIQPKGKLKNRADSKKSITKPVKDKSKGKSSKSKKKSKQHQPQEISESDKLFNQMIAEDELIPGACGFESDRKEWENVLQFPEPSIEVPVVVTDLDLLRDVFRTILTIRLIHMKTIPPDTKKSKSKLKENKKGKRSSKTKSEIEPNKETPKEVTVSRILLAKIKLPLQSICWNDISLDYSWSKSKPLQAKLSPNVRLLQYTMKKNKNKSKKPKSIKSSETLSQEIPLPTILTCHIGVGVKRC